MFKLLIVTSMLLLAVGVQADSNINNHELIKEAGQSKKLDLSVPKKDLEYKADDAKSVYVETKEQEKKRKGCAKLSREIDSLKNKLRPARRTTLVYKYRAECQGKTGWKDNSDLE